VFKNVSSSNDSFTFLLGLDDRDRQCGFPFVKFHEVNVVVTIDDVKARRRIPSRVELEIIMISIEDYVLALVVFLKFVDLLSEPCILHFVTLF